MPENSGAVRHAALKRSSSARRPARAAAIRARSSAGTCQGVVVRRQQRALAREQPRFGSALVDGEVVDHGLHGEGHGVLQPPLGVAHDGGHALLRFRLAPGREQEPHAAAGHAAQHPEAPEILAHFAPRACRMSESV